MAIEHLKQASRTAEDETGGAREVVASMLAAIAADREAAVLDYACKLDRWAGPIVVTAAEIEHRAAEVPAGVRQDIEFATAQVRRFAQAQRDSVREFSV